MAPESGDGDSGATLLRMSGISKSYFGTRVLTDVDLECRAGEIHAVVGENGAGKSTLMKILAGATQPDAGSISLDGAEVRFSHPDRAQRLGISIMYQEFTLLPDRTVAQNVFVGREPRHGPLVDTRAMEAATARLLTELRVEDRIRPDTPVRELPVGLQQMVEIAKALSLNAQVLIMDEPTAALAPHEVESLFDRVRLLKERGLGIIYISHRLPEVFELADRITVLKDGARTGTVERSSVTPAELVRMMVGRELSHYYPARAARDAVGEVRLRVHCGTAGILHDIDLEVRAGEIVGVAGLEGSGTTELARVLFGAGPMSDGYIELDGTRMKLRGPRQAIRNGLGFLSEDRKAEGLVLPLSVRDNSLLAVRSLGLGVRRRLMQGRSVAELARRVDLRTKNLDTEVQYLSGGNQQKVVLAKWLATQSKVFIFDEPTRGIDVGAKAGIHELMRELAQAGAGIVMVSTELPEIIGMSDRVIVLRDGAMAGEVPAGAGEDEIMLLATGQARDEAAS